MNDYQIPDSMITHDSTTAVKLWESMPRHYRLAKINSCSGSELNLQGCFYWSQGPVGGFEWRTIETVVIENASDTKLVPTNPAEESTRITKPQPVRPVTANANPQYECHGLDTQDRVCFYEQDFYVLSNFSAFSLVWKSLRFDTLEHAYHWEKFRNTDAEVAYSITRATSAHEAFKIAEQNKEKRRKDWDDVKVEIMKSLLRQKVRQHPYVKRKLLSTGDRELVENSWRDSYWGWGPDKDGQNMLGKLWMLIREELRNG